ncbi:MAG TPA: DNA recombination protein RmuC [Terracidiphilus sp.]
MNNSALLSALMPALIAVAALILGLLIGLWIGSRMGSSAAQEQIENERKLAESREEPLHEQLESAYGEMAELRIKAAERERFKAQAEERDAAILGLRAEKADLEARLTSVTGERELFGKLLATAEQQLRDEEKKYTLMKADLDTAFKGAAADALRANTQSFLALAREQLGGQTTEAKQTLEAKELAIKNLLDPLGSALMALNAQAQEMEKSRAGAYSEVKTLVENIQNSIPASLAALKNETAQLITALRAPKTRGNWGELQLKRCVEYAGMVQYCSFSEQVTARDEDDKMLRPDMTIQLPNGREIVVDAKTPLDAFLDASGAADPAAQTLRFADHARRVKEHLKDLSSKAYWKQFENVPDFVVCFLPSEALFSAALEADPSLIEFSAQNHVVMATPTTLIALLRAVEFGWLQSEITQNAKAIHEIGLKIYKKLVVAQGHISRLGNALGTSVETYNQFIGTIEGKGSVFSYGRQLGELAHSDGELAEVRKLQPDLREMESPEWSQPGLALAAGTEESEEAG